jgi:acid phosphatase
MKSGLYKLVLAGIFCALFSIPVLADPAPVNPVSSLNKVVWVWLENTPHSQMILQKYVKSLSATYPNARFTNYLPNSAITQADAMMMIGGADFGIQDNSSTTIFSPTVIDLLESKNVSWKIYAEDYPGACYLGDGIASYKRYRVPFLSISHVQSDRYQCMKIVGFANLKDDVKYNTLPRFSVVIPNLANSGGTTDALTADNNLKTVLDPIVKMPNFLQTTTVIISTINSSNTAVGKKEMFTMVLGAGVQTGSVNVTTAYSHANVLRTIENGLDIGNLNQADAAADPMVGFWK